MTTTLLSEIVPDPTFDPLRMAVAAYLARYKGHTRVHNESDLRSYLYWCAERGLEPFAAKRPPIELYVRWMQQHRRLAPSTISRRIAIVSGFYRTCVIDGVLEHSPAEYVRRPNVPPESPTLGLSHLQFEAMLAAARESANRYDFALVCLLGLLGLRIFEACGVDVTDPGEEHGHRVLRVVGKGHKVVLIPLPPAGARAVDRAVDGREAGPILLNRCGTRMDRMAATRRLRRLQNAAGVRIARMHPHMLRHTFVTTMLDAGSTCATPRSRPGMPTRGRRCATTEPVTISTGTRTTSSPPTCCQAPEDRPPCRRARHAASNARSHASPPRQTSHTWCISSAKSDLSRSACCSGVMCECHRSKGDEPAQALGRGRVHVPDPAGGCGG
jgi:site-specific recombinase XerD